MTTMTDRRSDAQSVGQLLRWWREQRRYSQQELSSRSTVSTRHLSRVETGRARPTAEMIDFLAETLDVPLRERNRLLLAGGYAPKYSDAGLGHDCLAVVMDGLRGLLDAHRPFPALLLDEQWTIVDANDGVDVLLAGCDPDLLEPPINAIRLSLHPRGLASRIENLSEWGAHLYQQVRHRADRTRDPAHDSLADEILTYLGEVPRVEAAGGPVLTMSLRVDGGVLRMFSTAAQLTTAADTALDGLTLETFLPADEATRRFFAGSLDHAAGAARTRS